MPASVPRMHGLTHVPGGPDPIPGLNGGGGGALEWEDVGTGNPPAAGRLTYSGSYGAYADGTVIPSTASVLQNMSAVSNGLQITVAGTYLVSFVGGAALVIPFAAGRGCGFEVAGGGSTLMLVRDQHPDGAAAGQPWMTTFSFTLHQTFSVGATVQMYVHSYQGSGFGGGSSGTAIVAHAMTSLWKVA